MVINPIIKRPIVHAKNTMQERLALRRPRRLQRLQGYRKGMYSSKVPKQPVRCLREKIWRLSKQCKIEGTIRFPFTNGIVKNGTSGSNPTGDALFIRSASKMGSNTDGCIARACRHLPASKSACSLKSLK